MVDFKNTVIIMTTNLGSRDVSKGQTLGFAPDNDDESAYERMKAKVQQELKQHFRPEFLNRIDDVIVFHQLTKDDLRLIIEIEVKGVMERLHQRKITLDLTEEAKLHLIDLQYADIRPDKGLYHRLVRLGRIERLLDDAEVAAAMHKPPEDTRAYFRGRCLEQYADQIAAASWDSVIFDLPGRESLQRVPTIDPMRGSKAHVGELLDRCDTAEALFSALTR